jgi:hypothetical protein
VLAREGDDISDMGWMVAGFFIAGFAWLAFLGALTFAPARIDGLWKWFRKQPPSIEVILGVVTLPWTLGMAAWESNWPFAFRSLAVLVLAVATMGLMTAGLALPIA